MPNCPIALGNPRAGGSPDVPDTASDLSVYDGMNRIGLIVAAGPRSHIAFTAMGEVLGAYASTKAAFRAIGAHYDAHRRCEGGQ